MKTTSVKRLLSLSTVAAVIATTTLAVMPAKGQSLSLYGDELFLGFMNTNTLRYSSDYLVNLGSISTYAQATSVITVGNYSTDLTRAFTSAWYNNSGLYWGAVGGIINRANSNTSGFLPASLFITAPTTNMSVPGKLANNPPYKYPENVPDASYNSSFYQDVTAVGNTYVDERPTSTESATNAVLQPISTVNNWYSYQYENPNNGNVVFDYFNQTVQSAFNGTSPTNSILDLYAIQPSGSYTPGLNLGYFQIDNLGKVTFTPYALTKGGSSYAGPWVYLAGSGNWGTTNNWQSNQAATNGVSVGFAGTTGGSVTNNAVSSVGSLTFSNTAGAYTLSGSNLAVTGGITNNSTNLQSLALNVSFSSNQTVSASVGSLIFKSQVSNTGTLTMTESSNSVINFGGTASIVGSGGIVQNGPGTLALNSSNSYTGGTIINGGLVNAQNNYAFGAGAVTVASNTTIRDLTLPNLTLSNTISVAAGTFLFLNDGTNTWNQNGALSGSGIVTVTGTGTMTLNGNSSSFAGVFDPAQGVEVLGANSQLGGTVNISSNTTFRLSSGSSLSSTNATHTVNGSLVDNSGLAFANSIKGSVKLAGLGTLQKTYAASNSVAGFRVSYGTNNIAFQLLAGSVSNASTLSASLVGTTNFMGATATALNFKGTYSNPAVISFIDSAFTASNNTIKWYDTNVAAPVWTNTIYGNTGNATNSAYHGFAGSFNTFLSNSLSLSLATLNASSASIIATDLQKIMGAYGYDSTVHQAWAVIDHNSIFDPSASVLPDLSSSSVSEEPGKLTAVAAVPEPSTWALMLMGGGLMAFFSLRKRNPQLSRNG